MEELRAESMPPLLYARILGSSWMPKVQNKNLPWVHALNRANAIKKNRSLMKYRQNLRQNGRIDYRSLIDILLNRNSPIDMSMIMSQRNGRKVSPNPFDYLKPARELPVKRNDAAIKKPRWQNNISDDIIKITTIIETVRRRRKRSTESDKKERNSNESVLMKSLREKYTGSTRAVPEKTLNRKKRSLSDQQNSIPVLNIQGETKEIPHRKIDLTIPIKPATVTPEIPLIPYIPLLPPKSDSKNFLDFSVLESILNIKKNTSTPKYTPVFSECNDTAATEIADLNIPPPKPKYIKRKKPIIPDIDFPRTPISLPPAKITHSTAVSTPVKEVPRNLTYINLQDHQKRGQAPDIPKDDNGYPADIPNYNPENIPYVDVPDYTDRREESLDEDDRRVANEKYKDYDDAEADTADPGTPSEDGEQSRKTSDAHVNRKTGERQQSDDDDDEEEEEERPSRMRDKLQKVSRNQDDEENEEEEEEEDERSSHVRYEAPQVRRNQDDEEGDEETPSRLERTEQKNQYENKDEEDDEEDDDKAEEESQKVKTERITKAEYDAVHFDINEYTKPFNLEEFLKEELFFEPDEKPEKTEDINEQESSKNIPVRDDLRPTDNKNNSNIEIPKEFISPFKIIFSELPSEDANSDIYKGEESVIPYERHERSERADRTDDVKEVEPEQNDDESAEYSSDSDDKQAEEDNIEEKIVSDEEFKFGDKDFFKPIANSKNGEFLHSDSNEDFFTRTFGPEIAAQLREPYERDDDDDDTERTNESKTSENTDTQEYKTLSTILSRKDDISRLNENINEKAKKGEEVPPEYKNAWTLEYQFPEKKKEEVSEVEVKKN